MNPFCLCCSPHVSVQVFDRLSYSKGACVIRQLEAAIGAEAFKKVGGWVGE